MGKRIGGCEVIHLLKLRPLGREREKGRTDQLLGGERRGAHKYASDKYISPSLRQHGGQNCKLF